MFTKENLTEVMNGILASHDDKIFAIFKGVLEKTELPDHIDFSDPENMRLFLKRPLEEFIGWIVKKQVSADPNVVGLYQHYSFFESHFSEIIRQVEGSACSADKSHYLMRKVLNFYKNGMGIEHDYDQEYIYQIPKEVFRTHDEIIAFFVALRATLFGNVRPYLEWCKTYLVDKKQ